MTIQTISDTTKEMQVWINKNLSNHGIFYNGFLHLFLGDDRGDVFIAIDNKLYGKKNKRLVISFTTKDFENLIAQYIEAKAKLTHADGTALDD